MVRSGVGFGRAADRRDTRDGEEAAETTPGSGPERGQAVVTASCCGTAAGGGGEAQGGWVGPSPWKCQEAVGSPSLGPGGQAVREEEEVKPPPTPFLQWGAAGSCAPRNACRRGGLCSREVTFGAPCPECVHVPPGFRLRAELRLEEHILTGSQRPGSACPPVTAGPGRAWPTASAQETCSRRDEGTGRGAQPPAPPAVPGPGEGEGTRGDIAATFSWLQKSDPGLA